MPTARQYGRYFSHLITVVLLAAVIFWPAGSLLANTCDNAGEIQLRGEVTISPEERVWIASLPTQRVGVLHTTAPLAERDKATGTYSGITIDVFCFIAKELNLRYQLVDSLNDLGTPLQEIQQGQLDMLMPLSRQIAREPYGLFTRPYFISHYVVVSLKDQPRTLDSLATLPTLRIGVIAQSALARDLEAIVPNQNLIPIELSAGKHAFYQALRSGDVDMLVMNKDIFTEDKYRDEMFDLEVSQILTQFPRKYGFYFSRATDQERLVALFDRYLAHIDAAGSALRHEVGERTLIERYLSQKNHLVLQQALMVVSLLSLLLLLIYIRHYRRSRKQLVASHQQVLEQQQALLEANQQLERMSMTDGLTGLANRRRFDERMALEFAQCKRTQRPLSVLMIDLDHFKQVNDQLGHAVGDEYLRQIAQELMRFCRRPTDLLARYGGEEIICLLPETVQPEAIQIAEKMRAAVASLKLPNPTAPEGHVTLSVGVSTQTGQHATSESLLAETDTQLYRAKGLGRNQVCSY